MVDEEKIQSGPIKTANLRPGFFPIPAQLPMLHQGRTRASVTRSGTHLTCPAPVRYALDYLWVYGTPYDS